MSTEPGKRSSSFKSQPAIILQPRSRSRSRSEPSDRTVTIQPLSEPSDRTVTGLHSPPVDLIEDQQQSPGPSEGRTCGPRTRGESPSYPPEGKSQDESRGSCSKPLAKKIKREIKERCSEGDEGDRFDGAIAQRAMKRIAQRRLESKPPSHSMLGPVRYHRGLAPLEVGTRMLLDARRWYRARQEWISDILAGTIPPPHIADADEHFQVQRGMMSVFVPERYHCGPADPGLCEMAPQTAPAVLQDPTSVQTFKKPVSETDSGHVWWYIQRMDNRQIVPCGWHVGDRILITAKAPDPNCNYFIGIPSGMLPGDREVTDGGPKHHGGRIPDNTVWTHLMGSCLRNSTWELRFSQQWMSQWRLHQRVEDASMPEEALTTSAPAEELVSAPMMGGGAHTTCARRQHEEWRRRQPTEAQYNEGDTFRGFEFELPTSIPDDCEWVPDTEGGQGSYILSRSPAPLTSGPWDHEPAPAGPGGGEGGPRVVMP